VDEGRFIVERRITQRVHDYWASLCRGRRMPEESDIDPEQLGDDWPHCFLLQTRDIHHIEHFNFTYLGEGIVDAYAHAGIDPENLYMVGPNAFYLAPQFLRVVKTMQPMFDENQFVNACGRTVRYRQCLLPIGHDRHVEAIFGAILFKIEPTPR
jgi:hypothetical protein